MDSLRSISTSGTRRLVAALQIAVLTVTLLALSERAEAGGETPNAGCTNASKSAEQAELVPLLLDEGDPPQGPSVSVLELSAKFPRQARRAFEKALKAVQDSQGQKAQWQLVEALTIEPRYFQASTLLATLLFNSHNYSAARLYAERAHDINPQYLPALEILGALDALDGKFSNAISELSEVVRLAPRREAAHHYLGIALLHQRNCPEGNRQLKIAAELRDHPLRQKWTEEITARLPGPPDWRKGLPEPPGGWWGGKPPQ